jgi:hypothetical protein
MACLNDCRLVELPTIADPRGNLTFAQDAHVPFEIKRVFFLHGIPEGSARGGHAHHSLEELMIAAAGRFDVVLDDGQERRRITLSLPTVGLYVPPMIWRHLENFSSDATLTVLASTLFDAEDYIRDHDAFVKLARVALR